MRRNQVGESAWEAGVDPSVLNLIHGHLDRNVEVTRAFAMSWPCIIPLRDPLSSLITRQNRHPEQSHAHIIRGFKNMHEMNCDLYEPFFFPVDLLKEETRDEWVMSMIDECGLTFRVKPDWTPVNSKGDYPLKRAYQERDLRTIRKNVKEFNMLYELDLDFFKSQGYDLWWM